MIQKQSLYSNLSASIDWQSLDCESPLLRLRGTIFRDKDLNVSSRPFKQLQDKNLTYIINPETDVLHWGLTSPDDFLKELTISNSVFDEVDVSIYSSTSRGPSVVQENRGAVALSGSA